MTSDAVHLPADHGHGKTTPAVLFLGCIGVVYGDIGTSPLYALREALVHSASDGLLESEIIGVVSLLLWTLTVIVTIKYVLLIMMADNEGEGGTLSLLALAQKAMGRRNFLIAIGIIGAALFSGDAAITPAISVLSAVEGIKLIAPGLTDWVLPITSVILAGLFLIQSRGTAKIARWFGPITLLWFVVMGVLGLLHIGDRPDVLHALNPYVAVAFVVDHGVMALVVLGSVFLAVTGAEALYADMGHFGRSPIRRAWASVVFPALALNYLGQGALILANPEAMDNPFFLLAPDWFLIPLVLLATVATVVASQSVITGAFSMAQQAVQLGIVPRLNIKHTSEHQVGQIYIPVVNSMLFVLVMTLVWTFQTSGALANAYGIAVTGVMLTTSILGYLVFRHCWNWPTWKAAAVIAPLAFLELVFLGSNLAKVLAGGYVPLGIAAVVSMIMWTWIRGTRIAVEKARRNSISLTKMCEVLKAAAPLKARGTAVYLTSDPDTAPSALMHNLKHNGVLHERNIIMTVKIADVPRVPDSERIVIEPIWGSFQRAIVNFGYMDEPNVPKAMGLAKKQGLKFEIMATSFFLSRRVFRATQSAGMPAWQDSLYIAMSASAADASNFYHLPTNRVVEMGQQITI